MDVTITELWKCWQRFRRGKRRTVELDAFAYDLEANLSALARDLAVASYRHGGYRRFTVFENKRREIVVASIRDRIVHRLVYEYLVPIFDKTFIYDVWSCRVGKGVVGAIERTQTFTRKYCNGCFWRADVQKFFDHVDHTVLIALLRRRVQDARALAILQEIIGSYSTSAVCERERESKSVPRKGLPIGNLTSQILANIYLNEFDRFVVHELKPLAYVRYGDDFVLFAKTRAEAERMRTCGVRFLREALRLSIHSRNDVVCKTRHGVRFLGVRIYPLGRALKESMWCKIQRVLSRKNVASYGALVRLHGGRKRLREVIWRTRTLLDAGDMMQL